MYLAFDPGVTTGIALVGDDGAVITTHAVQLVTEVGNLAEEYMESYPDLDVAVESPPTQSGNYRAHTQEVEAVIKRHCPDAEWINPGQWKGHPSARPTQDLRGKTQHEKDAAGLARFLRVTRSSRAGSRSTS